MRNWLKTALFVSAFSPALVSIAVSRYFASGFVWDQAFYAFFGLSGMLVTFYVTDALRWYGESFRFKARKVEPNDALMLAFVVSYFLPFFGKAAEITPTFTLMLLALAAAVLWFMSSAPPSPAMRLLGFRFYKVESDNGMVYTVITQRDLLDPSDIKQVKRISKYTLIESHDAI